MYLSQIIINWGLIAFIAFCITAGIQILYYLFIFKKFASYTTPEKVLSQEYPVSIIICARDEAEDIASNLPGVLVQKYRTTHEVVLVNDNSTDETKYLIEEFQRIFKQLQPVILKQEAVGIPGKKFPLSVGIKSAKHEVLLLTDADCVPASELWLQKMQDAYTDGIDIVLGYGAYQKSQVYLISLSALKPSIQHCNIFLMRCQVCHIWVWAETSLTKGNSFYRIKGFHPLIIYPAVMMTFL